MLRLIGDQRITKFSHTYDGPVWSFIKLQRIIIIGWECIVGKIVQTGDVNFLFLALISYEIHTYLCLIADEISILYAKVRNLVQFPF